MLRDRLISDLCPSTGLVVWQGLRKRSFREDRQGSRAGREAKPRGRGTRGAKSLQVQGKGGMKIIGFREERGPSIHPTG